MRFTEAKKALLVSCRRSFLGQRSAAAKQHEAQGA
jgi:hypothetical protein